MEDKFKILSELLKEDRSYRRFDENVRIDREILYRLIGLTRFCASGRNLQPLKYYIVNDYSLCDEIFPLLKWAGYLADWDGPVKGERPAAYLIQCLDTRLTKNYLCDDGLQLQTITLGAAAMGLGCCIIKSFNSVSLKKLLDLSDYYEPLYVIALGKPIEKIELEETKGDSVDDIKYYRTPDGTHHVPKRPMDELIINK